MPAIIFDFDGTIADSFKVIVEIGQVLTHRPKSISKAELNRMRGMSFFNLARELHVPSYKWPYLLFRGRNMMTKRLNEIHPFSGIEDVLKELSHFGYDLYIMSSNSTKNVQKFLAQHDLASYFKGIQGGVSVRSKTKALEQFIGKYRLATEPIFYIGDEPRDITAAKGNHVGSIAVTWGYSTEVLLATEVPDWFVRKPSDILSYLQSNVADSLQS